MLSLLLSMYLNFLGSSKVICCLALENTYRVAIANVRVSSALICLGCGIVGGSRVFRTCLWTKCAETLLRVHVMVRGTSGVDRIYSICAVRPQLMIASAI